ncbi:hypothetical protein I3760_15G091300 [Carya illinoinensis]|nr:hypothetical protein I3760_15G091300 [Carya illinoinensis]
MVVDRVYGHPESGQWSEVWSLLKFLGRGVVLPWLVFGDFNEILDHFEKLGGNIRSELQMREFREVLSNCQLRDLGYEGEGIVKERLDRFLANSLWCEMYLNLRVKHGVAAYSDHIPLWLDTEGALIRRRNRRLFRFEAMWVGEKECSSIIERAWCQRNGSHILDQIMGRIFRCATELGRWNKVSFGLVQKNLATAKRRLQCLEENDSGSNFLEEHKQACLEVQKWLERDELMWKQRSRVKWHREGDCNSRYFHSKASTRMNSIIQLQEESGLWHKGDRMDVLITGYFQNLFTTADHAKVTAEMNEELLKPYVAEEVEKYWGVIALNSGMFSRGLNHTFITLIPKKASPSKVADFHPISLFIANRLKRVLPDISDNGRKGFMSLKLDMKKIMESLGFDKKLISLIIQCVRIVSFFVLVNGSPKGSIIPSRGLRQGDLLSPYLFLLCTEDLISLLKRNVGREGVDGIRICRGAPRINHLLFVNDSVIFCKADVITNVKIQSLLNKYERALGQCINKEKTSMVFSKNLWGLPPMVGRVWQKLQVWKGNLLSQGGRELLIKAVAMSILTYAMSCSLFPKTLCHELEMMMEKFWWGDQSRENKIHWCSGMGFRDLHLFNLVLLAKQGWRLLRNEDSLLYKVYKAKYFPNSSLFEAKVCASSSYIWKGIWEALDCLRKGCRWRVGNGQTVRTFKDPWLPNCSNVSALVEVDEDLKVHSLIDASIGWWNVHMVRALFNPNLVQQILKLHVSVNSEDSLFWSHEKNGSFSAKSAYRYLQQSQHHSNGQSCSGKFEAVFWKSLWHLKLPKKMKIFAWRACQEKLPTYLNLKKKHVMDDGTCVLCNQGMEDAAHALYFCSEILNLFFKTFEDLWRAFKKLKLCMSTA